MAKVLLVDDDVDFADKLTRWLKGENYTVDTVHSGADALQLVNAFKFDVIVLDWQMPEMTGLQVCEQLRATGHHTPILFLTGLGDIDHKESGLNAGGDDYLVKPFDPRELTARIKSLLRRPTAVRSSILQVGSVSFDPSTLTLASDSQKLKVTQRECALLEYLMRHTDQHFSARALRDSVWPSSGEATDEAVRTCMKTLRQKLKGIGLEDFIKTMAGAGYFIESNQ